MVAKVIGTQHFAQLYLTFSPLPKTHCKIHTYQKLCIVYLCEIVDEDKAAPAIILCTAHFPKNRGVVPTIGKTSAWAQQTRYRSRRGLNLAEVVGQGWQVGYLRESQMALNSYLMFICMRDRVKPLMFY